MVQAVISRMLQRLLITTAILGLLEMKNFIKQMMTRVLWLLSNATFYIVNYWNRRSPVCISTNESVTASHNNALHVSVTAISDSVQIYLEYSENVFQSQQ